ncbi:DUF2637 domain-containing protein [Nocardia asteroides]|uniref:DUF2637 domain-containing protein n=1 Tax=Nocardia asteroides TaxID=1824 RepID=UPI001E567754|nr:DUF2637 domain-containing protein [Nocardia asteroides]UGT63409.1 DUF2637 domain-containing protein [Nocardia asteroides]
MSERSTAMRVARWVAVLVIVTIGVAAFALSIAALKELAIMARTPRELAWLWPVIVDGTIIQATISMLVLASGPERRWFLGVLVCGALVSVIGNSVHAAMAGEHLPWWAAALVAAVAPVSLLVDTHGLGMLFRASNREPITDAVAVPEPSAVAVSEPIPAPAPVRRRKPAARRDPAKVTRAIEMHADGKRFPEIAAALGVSTSTARNYVGKATPADTPAPASAPEPDPVPEPAVVRPAPFTAPVRPVLAARPRPVVQPMLPLAVAGGN